MTPILFDPHAKEWTTEGRGRLTDAISCRVTEAINGEFELEMQYPAFGQLWDQITENALILASPSPYRRPQPFRVYAVEKEMRGVCRIKAHHLSYDLAGIPVRPYKASSAPAAVQGLKQNAYTASNFKFYTTLTSGAKFENPAPTSTRRLMGGTAGSLIDVFGGEYYYDGWTVQLQARRGKDAGVSIAYGKNLLDLSQGRDVSGVYSGIVPFWTDPETGQLISSAPEVIPAPGSYAFSRLLPVDFSAEYQDPPTPQQLAARGEKYVKDNKIGIPKVNLRVKFAPLEQAAGLENLKELEACELGDTVQVHYPDLQVDASARIVKTTTDVLADKYDQIDIGRVRASIVDTIMQQGTEIASKPGRAQVLIWAATITATLLGAKGGAVRLLDTDGDDLPDTLYIADNPDPAQAVKVWRFNYEGWGASRTGWGGPYVMGATLDDGILAEAIRVGVMTAIRIQSEDESSWWDLKTGQLHLAGEFETQSGDLVMKMWAGVQEMLNNKKRRIRLDQSLDPDFWDSGCIEVFSGNSGNDYTAPSQDERHTAIYSDALFVGASYGAKGQKPAAKINKNIAEFSESIRAGKDIYAGERISAKGDVITTGVNISDPDGFAYKALSRIEGETNLTAGRINNKKFTWRSVQLVGGGSTLALCQK